MLLSVVSLLAFSASGLALSPVSQPTKGSFRRKVILDNDWGTTEFLPFLQALNEGWDVLGLIGDTCNTWALQSALHARATLDIGNMTCIPVYRGADYPILNTPKLARARSQIYGKLPWEGAFALQNSTFEAEGNDPTDGDPNRISTSAFVEGYPRSSYVRNTTAVEFLIRTVREHPGEVSIFSAGALTNIALAQRVDSTFAKNAKELVVMGGYIDVNLLQATGGLEIANIQSDINLKLDPEASKIALTAPFPKITIVGNAANQVIPSEAFIKEVAEVDNPYTRLFRDYYDRKFPLWDATAAAVMLDPGIITNSTEVYVDVDTSDASPSYGNIYAYGEELKPEAQDLQKVHMVVSVNEDKFKQQIKKAMQTIPKVC